MVKINGLDYTKSTRKGKKLMVKVNNVIIHFGNVDYQHYKDKTGIWSSLNHFDKKRRNNYLTRSAGITNKEGKLTKDDKTSPNYHSRKILW